MAFLSGVAAAVTGLGGAPGAQPEMNSLNNRNEINVAPVGVNIGAMMQPYTENPVNGGLGLLTQAPRFSGSTPKAHAVFTAPSKLLKQAGDKVKGGDFTPFLVAAGLLTVAFIAARRS